MNLDSCNTMTCTPWSILATYLRLGTGASQQHPKASEWRLQCQGWSHCRLCGLECLRLKNAQRSSLMENKFHEKHCKITFFLGKTWKNPEFPVFFLFFSFLIESLKELLSWGQRIHSFAQVATTHWGTSWSDLGEEGTKPRAGLSGAGRCTSVVFL